MTRHACARAWWACSAIVLLSGCMPKMTMEEMKSMMPPRPVELDRLDAFAGEWDVEGEMTMAMIDGPIKTSGSNEAHWEGNRRYLVNRGKFGMGDLDPMEAIETWTYDAHSKIYRSTWVDSMGSVGLGTGRYNEKTGTWAMRAKAHGPFGATDMKGTVKFIDDDTMEWTWSEYMFCGLLKTTEMKGISRRR